MNKTTVTLLLSILFIFPTQFTQAQCHIDDWKGLKALYDSTNGNNWTNRMGWDIVNNHTTYPANNCDLNTLYGVTLTNGRVTCIDMDGNPDCNFSQGGNNLSGTIPSEINKLSHLKGLFLFHNNLAGTLPLELFSLSSLEILGLRGNQLSGTIPPQIGDLNSLRDLYLDYNNFSGDIPVELANLSNLYWCNLSYNRLTGNIPPGIGSLSKLEALALAENNLTGYIPPQLYNLTKLQQLWLFKNGLTGTISPEIKKLKNLRRFSFWSNELEGVIPSEIGSLSELTFISLSANKLSGRLPIELGNLTKLEVLEISYNCLTGCYPGNFNIFCAQLVAPDNGTNSDISDGNKFDAEWEDFCATGAGGCITNEIQVSTIHSGTVSLTLNNNQSILNNDVATVYDYSTCSDYTNLEACNPVVGINNMAANEALWAITKAAEYLLSYHDIKIPPVNILVNYQPEPNQAKYNSTNNVIVLGVGDGIERKSMSAPDIVGHEYMHAVIKTVNNLGHYKISGAFNESYADIFGELVEYYCYGFNNDWIYGSQVMINAVGNKVGLRNLSYPKDITMKYQLPDTYKGIHWIHIDNVCFHVDNCGIHTNSGVHSYWFYLLANGGFGINDNGYNYNINGIGIEKAAIILFDNLLNYLNPQSTFIDAKQGSIAAVKTLHANQPAVLTTTIQAWDAVGIEEIPENPIKFRIKNAIQTEPAFIENDKTVIPVQFDLYIDSLGLNINADELYFTLHLPNTYMEMYIEKVYKPLLADEICFKKTEGEVNIYINRINNGVAKRGSTYPLIASNTSIFSAKLCIVSEDVGGEDFGIAPMEISGFTKIGLDEEISFKTATLPFGFDYEEDGFTNPSNKLNISLKLDHKNCNNLGTIYIEVLDKYFAGIVPYNYILKNVSNLKLDESDNSFETIYQFYNLEEGNYTVEVRDSNDNISSKKFNINFVGEQTGSKCCTENLIISPGTVSGEFNTNGIISLSNGTIIKEGTFEICDQ